jgi:predicted GIY-YIG superfamily endonuclease
MDNQHQESEVVRRQSAPRLTFEAAAIYEYPEHLRPFLSALPAVPGVYLFHSESDTMPLYIGKSVNIRSRVMAHLRTPNEAAMLRQAKRISWICTAGEIGALLLEARLIKEQQPLFNKRLRRNRQLCALQLTDRTVQVVYARDIDFSHAPICLACLPIVAPRYKRCSLAMNKLRPVGAGTPESRARLFRSALSDAPERAAGKKS